MSKVLIGKQAPEFSAQAFHNGSIIEDYSLRSLKGKYILFFFYPLDFTFVCPTELHAFQEKLSEFQSKDAEVVGCSIDSVFSHQAWWNQPRKQGGIEGISYPLVSDLSHTISRDYGVLKEDMGVAYRGLFLIDKEGIIRSQLINDLFLGRSIDEAMRLLEAMLFFEKHGNVCPANWKEGKRGMQADQKGLLEYFQNESK